MQSGNKPSLSSVQLKFEKVNSVKVLSGFTCGIASMDKFIHEGLQNYLNMGNCNMFTVKDGEHIVAMFCLDDSTLSLSEPAKENMVCGKKPKPIDAPKDEDSPYWWKSSYDAKEITYLAVASDYQNRHIGSFIIESILLKVASDKSVACDFLTVRALNEEGYSAIPFYKKCGFVAASEEEANKNLFMYRIIQR